MRVYLAGPMRGIDQFNFPAFFGAADALSRAGHEVISPARRDIEAYPDFDYTTNSLAGLDLRTAFSWDVQQVLECDAVALLPGWQGSRGASIEAAIAQTIGTPVYELTPDDRLGPEVAYCIADRLTCRCAVGDC